MFKQYWDKIPKELKNRYVSTSIFFIIWMIFFDSSDVFMLSKLRKELKTIESEKAYFKIHIEETKVDLDNLLNDNKKLEKFAREKYLMKNSNEDIFVIMLSEES